MPRPSERWGQLARPTSRRSGSSKTSGSRLAAPTRTATLSRARTSNPFTAQSARTRRNVVCTGESKRSSSSTVAGMRPGSSRSRTSWSGLSSSASMPLPIRLVVVLVAGDQQETQHVQHLALAQPLAAVLGVGQRAQDVVAGRVPALRDDSPEIRVELPRRLLGDRALTAAHRRLQQAGALHRPELEAVAVLGRDAPASRRPR